MSTEPANEPSYSYSIYTGIVDNGNTNLSPKQHAKFPVAPVIFSIVIAALLTVVAIWQISLRMPRQDGDIASLFLASSGAFLLILSTTLATLYICISGWILKRTYVVSGTTKHGHSIQFILRSINNLDRSILLHYCIGTFATFTAIITLTLVGIIVAHLFSGSTSQISSIAQSINDSQVVLQDPKSPWPYITILFVTILRTSLLATFIAFVASKTMSFAVKSFDQAARFTKRKHSAYFLMQMVINQKDFNLNSLPKIMNSFSIWNSSVDSAYTDKDATSEDKKPPKLFKTPKKTPTPKSE